MTRSNERALLVAVKHNLQESCARLLGEGVNVHCRDDDCEGGKTPILIAAEQGLDETLALLIAHGANVHDQCPVGMTPLHHAAWKGNETMIRALLAAGADVNACNRMQETPLHGAAHFAHEGSVKILLKRGANANVVSLSKRIPLDELYSRHDKKHARERIRQLLRRKSRETLYTILLSKDNNCKDTNLWFKRMLSTTKSPHACKVFFAAANAAEKLGLLSEAQANKWIERSLVQCMDHCRTIEDRHILKNILPHASKYGAIGETMKNVIQEFCMAPLDGDISEGQSILRKSIQKDVHKFGGLDGVDGKIESTKRCLDFFVNAVKEISWDEDGMQSRLGVLHGLFGVLLNAILHDGGDSAFDRFSSEISDFLDFDHMTRTVEQGDWFGHERTNLERLRRGKNYCEYVLETEMGVSGISDDSVGDGFVLFGLCNAILVQCTRENKGPRENCADNNNNNTDTTESFVMVDNDASTSANESAVRCLEESTPIVQLEEPQVILEPTHGDPTSAETRSEQARRRPGSARSVETGNLERCPLPLVENFSNVVDGLSRGGSSRTSRESSRRSRRSGRSHSTAPSTNTVTSTTIAHPSLHWAVVGGDEQHVKEELSRASVNGTLHELDYKGRSALDLAALSGQRGIFTLIEQAGGHRFMFKDDSEMKAVMAYCSLDPEANRHGLWRSYLGGARSSRGSLSANSSLSSVRSIKSVRFEVAEEA